MLFEPRVRAQQKRPGPYVFSMTPPPTDARNSGPGGMFLRAKRRAREKDTLPYIILLLGGSTVAAVAYSPAQLVPWSLALALGVSAFVLYIRFAYAVEGKRHLRPGRLPPTFLRVVPPRFPAVLLSLFVLAVWLKVFLDAPYRWSPVLLFVALLGVSHALFAGKTIQWVLDEFVKRRVSGRPSNRPLHLTRLRPPSLRSGGLRRAGERPIR